MSQHDLRLDNRKAPNAAAARLSMPADKKAAAVFALSIRTPLTALPTAMPTVMAANDQAKASVALAAWTPRCMALSEPSHGDSGSPMRTMSRASTTRSEANASSVSVAPNSARHANGNGGCAFEGSAARRQEDQGTSEDGREHGQDAALAEAIQRPSG